MEKDFSSNLFSKLDFAFPRVFWKENSTLFHLQHLSKAVKVYFGNFPKYVNIYLQSDVHESVNVLKQTSFKPAWSNSLTRKLSVVAPCLCSVEWE